MSARSKKKSRVGGAVAPLSEAMQECYEILRFLQTREDAQPFLEAVDWQAYGLTDYPEIITHPMDLGTIQGKLEAGQYKEPAQFASDVRLVFDNCLKYNRPDSDLYLTADKLNKLFDKKFAKLKAQSSSSSSSKGGTKGASSSSVPEASRAERLKLCQLVNQLTPEQLGTLVEMIQQQAPEALNEEEEEEIEIEVNNIDSTTLQSLIQFATQCVQGTDSNKKQKTK